MGIAAIQGKKILVVDDDRLMRLLVKQIFFKAGGEVFTASNGIEAITLFQTHTPDLVILDIMMPDMDGWETCRQIRSRSDVPIIILTALGNREDTDNGDQNTANDYVMKPFTSQVLITRAQAVLG
ncbi:MAG: response regulator [Chloroflexota bacterium]